MSRRRVWLSVFGILILIVVMVLVIRAYWPPSVGQIQVLESGSGPYSPDQTIVLSLPVESQGVVVYKWSNPDGGKFTAPIDGSSTRFVVPSEGPVRIICDVTVNGAKYERVFPISVNSSVASSNVTTGSIAAQVVSADGTMPVSDGDSDILSGLKLGRELDLGVDTSEKRRDWVKPTEAKDGLMLGFPGDPSWGAVFITVGKPRDRDRPGRDYSSFGSLEIEMQGERGDEPVDIGIKDSTQPDDGSEAKVAVKLTKVWRTYRFPLSKFAGADLRHLYVLCEFVFDGQPEKIYVRRIQYVK